MTKQAERPIKVTSGTFDSNDFVLFEIQTPDFPTGEIIFKGNPSIDKGLTELGRCMFDYCNHGTDIYQDIANMLYEAQHPWLDFADALWQDLIHPDQLLTAPLLCALNGRFHVFYSDDFKEDLSDITCFKPMSHYGWHLMKNVKVYKSPDTETVL